MSAFYHKGFLLGWRIAAIHCPTCNHFKNYQKVSNLSKKPMLIHLLYTTFSEYQSFLKVVLQMFHYCYQNPNFPLALQFVQNLIFATTTSGTSEFPERSAVRLFWKSLSSPSINISVTTLSSTWQISIALNYLDHMLEKRCYY